MHPTRLVASATLFALSLTACDNPQAPEPVANVVITPSSPFVVVNDSLRLTATALADAGDTLAGRTAQWTSSNQAIATVTSSGAVTGRAVGSVQITAAIEQRTATTTISVVQAPPASHVDDFFWSFTWFAKIRTTPIRTQIYDVSQCPEVPLAPCLDDNASLYRVQWNDVWDWQPVAAWAAQHPGHLYTVGDDLNAGSYGGIYVSAPKAYAADLCTFIRNVRKEDPTAKFSPTMIHDTVEDWWLADLVTGLLAEYQAGRCDQNPIDEWMFNVYPRWSDGLPGFTNYIGKHADWAATRPAPFGKPLVVGAFILGGGRADDIANDDPAYVARIREAKAWLFANPNVRLARYLQYEPWPTDNPDPHPLTDAAGTLNATGRAYAEVTGRIAGPKSVRPNATCMWTAETTGNAPSPFTYEWSVGGATVSSRHWLVYGTPSSSFTLQLRVTDGAGGFSVAKVDVSVSADAPACASP